LGSLALRTEAEREVMFNMLVAIAGAMTAELILAPVLGVGSLRSDFGLPALGGAIALLAIYSIVRGLAQRYRLSE
jgi:uncharacterized membrane protein YeaQ/YmgE (transglycosylase-associated protein family)